MTCQEHYSDDVKFIWIIFINDKDKNGIFVWKLNVIDDTNVLLCSMEEGLFIVK